jgi:hypothetical protein
MGRRRRTRILLNAATAVSLVLCAAAVVLWMWSYSHPPEITRGEVANSYQVFTVSRGRLVVFDDREPWLEVTGSSRPTRWRWYTSDPLDVRVVTDLYGPYHHTAFAGFFVGHHANAHTSRTTILLPMWFVVAALGVLPVVSARRARRRMRRTDSGHCPACNYDLRATPDRCPECGTMPAPRPPLEPG